MIKQIKKFQQKHNVGAVTLGLLTLFAVQNNVLNALAMYPGS
jgi:hypothetical protein